MPQRRAQQSHGRLLRSMSMTSYLQQLDVEERALNEAAGLAEQTKAVLEMHRRRAEALRQALRVLEPDFVQEG